jgi:hypothetical protein
MLRVDADRCEASEDAASAAADGGRKQTFSHNSRRFITGLDSSERFA